MDLRAKLNTNWRIWLLLSGPWVLVALFKREEDKSGELWSDWSYAKYLLHRPEWRYSGEIVFWDLVLPIVIGWVAHFFVAMAFQRVQVNRYSAEAAKGS